SGNEPDFGLALRRYDRKQVDRYIDRLVTEKATLLDESDEVFNQAQSLAAQLQQLQAEMADLRRRAVSTDRASYKHLGARVEQILTLAEEEAEYLKKRAINEVSKEREEA